MLRGLADALAKLDLPAASVTEIVHGFTVATNAILEGKGAPMALITTEGFRDVLEIARLRTPRLYDLYYRKPPLVGRRLRLELRERVVRAAGCSRRSTLVTWSATWSGWSRSSAAPAPARP